MGLFGHLSPEAEAERRQRYQKEWDAKVARIRHAKQQVRDRVEQQSKEEEVSIMIFRRRSSSGGAHKCTVEGRVLNCNISEESDLCDINCRRGCSSHKLKKCRARCSNSASFVDFESNEEEDSQRRTAIYCYFAWTWGAWFT